MVDIYAAGYHLVCQRGDQPAENHVIEGWCTVRHNCRQCEPGIPPHLVGGGESPNRYGPGRPRLHYFNQSKVGSDFRQQRQFFQDHLQQFTFTAWPDQLQLDR